MPTVSNGDLPPYDHLEPALVWEQFARLSAVPRPSHREERVRRHLLDLAAAAGLTARQDLVGNVFIEVPPSRGRERAAPVAIQAHIDMVCVRRSDSTHDFDNDPIALEVDRRDGETIVRARGTTLGADNGIGVALALAAALSPDVAHGPLELVFTVNEEAGMSGAMALAPDTIRARTLVNLDTEEDGVFYVGCAGAAVTWLRWEFATEPADKGEVALDVALRGLRGGHSGVEIHQGRGCANRLLARALATWAGRPLRLAHLEGGTKRNAIPDRAAAVILLPAAEEESFVAHLARIESEVRAELRGIDDAFALVTGRAPARHGRALPVDATRRVLDTLLALPHGVLAVHPSQRDLVHTSNNVAIVTTEPLAGKALRLAIENGSRSLTLSGLEDVKRAVAAIGRLAGAAVEQADSYPPWEPRLDAPLLATCLKEYESLFGERPSVATVHAGLETGLIARQIPGIEMISFGPRIEEAHTPDERVFVGSVARYWKYLGALLSRLSA